MRIDNQHHLDVYTSLFGSHQSLLKLVDNIVLESILGLVVGVHNSHLGFIPEIKLEPTVNRPTGQYTIARVRNSPRKDVMHCSSGTDTLDHIWGNGAVRSQVLVEVGSQSRRESRAPCMATTVQEVLM